MTINAFECQKDISDDLLGLINCQYDAYEDDDLAKIYATKLKIHEKLKSNNFHIDFTIFEDNYFILPHGDYHIIINFNNSFRIIIKINYAIEDTCKISKYGLFEYLIKHHDLKVKLENMINN